MLIAILIYAGMAFASIITICLAVRAIANI